MADIISIAPTSFTLPENPKPSSRYRARFNEVAKELEVKIEWVEDDKNPLVVDADEVRINPSALEKYESESPTPQKFSPALEKDVRKVLDKVEKRRLHVVEASALLHQRIPFRASLEILNKAEREAVELFAQEVKPILDRIEARQHDPNADQLREWMDLYGDYYSKILFSRFHRDTCAGIQYVTDPSCSSFPFYPEQPPLNGMIDPKLSLEDFKELSDKLPTEAEELRPTTVLSVAKEGKVTATPIPLHPNFKEDHIALAKVLENIANLNIEGDQLDLKLQDQLKKWAQFFRTGRAEDEAQAVQATIDAGESKGNLRVHLGPSESYWDDNTKFPYLLQVGIRDPKLSEEMAHLAETFLELERSLNTIPHYTSRELSTRGGFADPIYQAIIGGFIQTYPFAEPGGNNFPNYSGYHVEGGNRFTLLEAIAVSAAREKPILSKLLDEDISSWDALKRRIENVVNHESGHLLGPQRDHVTPSGEKMGAIFRKHWGDADEPKADLTHAEMVQVRYQNGEINREEAIDLLRSTVAYLLSKRYKGKVVFASGKVSRHYYGIMIMVGHFFKTGVFTLTPEEKIHIDYEKLMEEGSNLWRKIISFEAKGDLEGYRKMSEELVSHIPDEADKIIIEASKDLPLFFIERHL